MAALLPFDPQHDQPRAVPFAFVDYIEWLDYIGRAIHPHKRGAIPAELPKIAVRLNIDARSFAAQSQGLLEQFGQAVGIAKHLKAHSASHRLRHLHDMREARLFLGWGDVRQAYVGAILWGVGTSLRKSRCARH